MTGEHIIVLGGGIVGVSTAYHLARRGARVTLLERDTIDTGASTGNAGIIALGHEPLPRPGVIGRTLALLFDQTHPLYIKPRLSPDLVRWLWQFRKSCSETRFKQSMDVLSRLGWAAGECYETIIADESIECEYHRTGWMDVFRTRQALDRARRHVELTKRYGYNVQELAADALHECEPAFVDDVIGAMHYTDSAFANPRWFLVELCQRTERHGATVRPETPVDRILMDDGRFVGVETKAGERTAGDILVLAGGIWTTPLAASIGVRIPMQAGKGYHVHMESPPHRPTTTCVLNETFCAVTPIEGGLRLAGTVELSGVNHDINERRVNQLVVSAKRYIRGISDEQARSTWCGLRPLTADGLPVIGPAPGVRGVMIATGHAMMGFALGPLTGQLVSEMILDGRPSEEIALLSADRFQGRGQGSGIRGQG